MTAKSYLLFDISNLLHKTFYANQNTDDMTQAGLAHHVALTTLNKYYKLYKPHQVIMTYDRSNWRKAYTEDKELCYSGKVYKGQRRKGMTESQKRRYALFKDHLEEFEDIIREHTSIVCLAHDGLEADDLMAGFVQRYHDGNNITMISADKDLMQLLRYEGVSLVDPATGEERNLDEYDGDADLFMFEKCFRGDTGDNVQSAYPRIRTQKIRKAWSDPYLCANLMNHTWTNEDNKEFLVKRLFNENMLLMDLSKQPECIRRKIDETIDEGMENPGTFNYFKFLKFCGKYELKRVSEKLESYIPLLNS